MTPEQIQELLDLLINMGETMATGAYQAALDRVITGAIVWLVLSLIWLIVGTIFSIALEKEEKDGGGYFAFAITLVIFALFGVNPLIDLITPEWAAIEKVLSLIN